MKLDTLAEKIEEIAPLQLQESWDHSGWQLKLTDGEIHRVLIALEINEQVIEEAAAKGAEVILTHHPLLFSPVREIDCGTVTGNNLMKLIRHGISVYASHTPFDKCEGGNNDEIGVLLKLQEVQPMEGDAEGFCRCGKLMQSMTAADFADYAAEAFRIDKRYFSFAGTPDDMIQKIGWCSGAGADFLDAAFDAGCDLFLTGDVKYHTAQHAREIGMNLLDCGHYGTEAIFCRNMKRQLAARLHPWEDLQLMLSQVDLNPFVLLHGEK